MFTPFANQNQFDPNAGTFINTLRIGGAEAEAVNNLVLQLKNVGLWNKMYAIYPFVGGTSATFQYNLVNVGRDTLTYGGTPTFSSTGITGNGTNAFYNTLVNPRTNTFFGQNDISTFIYIRTNAAEDKVDFGNIESNIGFNFGARSSTNTFTSRCNDNTLSSSPASTTSIGFFGISRTSSANYDKFYNGTITNITQVSTLPTSRTMIGLGVNSAGTGAFFSTKQHAATYMAKGLTSTEMFNLYNINTEFQKTLGRFAG